MGTLCGTPEYLSPELVLSKGHDRGVDFWAFGILIYEMLCGGTPFADEEHSRIFVKIVHSQRCLTFPGGMNRDVEHLIRRLLNPNPPCDSACCVGVSKTSKSTAGS